MRFSIAKFCKRRENMAKKTKRVVRIIILSFVVVLIAGIIYALTPDKIENYSEEEHARIIREKIDKKYPDKKHHDDRGQLVDFTGYELYPLYDEHEKLKYFLVEYEPYGFKIIEMVEGIPRIIYGGLVYYDSDLVGVNEAQWSPHTIDENTELINGLEKDKIWILDENGERIYHKKSPFSVTGNINERKYLIRTYACDYIFAVKKDGQFINLVSGEEVDFDNLGYQATLFCCVIPQGPWML
jgi:hypothetical protein